METKLERITQLSKRNPDMVFTSIGHLINIEMLKDCHAKMDKDKAVGIDGITKDEYSRKLDENLADLMNRMKRKAYHPKPARRVEIPKDNGKTRPLSIYCYEDKLVQEALRRLIEAVFEPCFYDEMMGFRPNRSCHDALRLLDNQIGGQKTGWVLDADIRGFFDNIDHDWMMKFVEARIKDPRVLRLVRVMLKAGVVKDMGEFEATEQGSGQGSVCSPVLANVYMHYVLLWWFHEVIQPKLHGYAGIVNYADDFVVCFQHKDEAEAFYKLLGDRMEHFGLSLEKEKSFEGSLPAAKKMYQVGTRYYHSGDYEEAAASFMNAVNMAEYRMAYFSLATMYYEGKGVDQSLTKALEYACNCLVRGGLIADALAEEILEKLQMA